jgi:hypothetical protein
MLGYGELISIQKEDRASRQLKVFQSDEHYPVHIYLRLMNFKRIMRTAVNGKTAVYSH